MRISRLQMAPYRHGCEGVFVEENFKVVWEWSRSKADRSVENSRSRVFRTNQNEGKHFPSSGRSSWFNNSTNLKNGSEICYVFAFYLAATNHPTNLGIRSENPSATHFDKSGHQDLFVGQQIWPSVQWHKAMVMTHPPGIVHERS